VKHAEGLRGLLLAFLILAIAELIALGIYYNVRW
jgi:hypothetical protein